MDSAAGQFDVLKTLEQGAKTETVSVVEMGQRRAGELLKEVADKCRSGTISGLQARVFIDDMLRCLGEAVLEANGISPTLHPELRVKECQDAMVMLDQGLTSLQRRVETALNSPYLKELTEGGLRRPDTLVSGEAALKAVADTFDIPRISWAA